MLEIRLLTVDDLDELWALRLAALEQNPEVFGATYDETVARGIESMRERLVDSHDEAFYLGACDPTLCGMVRFTQEDGSKDRHKGYITSLFVRPEQRGHGVARALMAELIERARRLDGLEQIHLSVVTSNAEAGALYRALGFTVYGTEPHALKVGTQYWDEDLMVLRLQV